MRIIQRDIACGLIESADQQILMGRKAPDSGGVYLDCWQIPGGGIEAGETELAALEREMQEEVGIDIGTAQVNLIDRSGTGTAEKTLASGEVVLCQMNFIVFQVCLPYPAPSISIVLSSDLVEARWFTRASLRSVKLVPAGEVLFAKLGYL